MKRALILVVDAETSAREAIVDILTLDGHEVDPAADAEAALLLLEQRHYDLVLSDLRMPGLDGPALYRALEQRGEAAAPSVIFLTERAFEPHFAGFLADVGARVLVKPSTAARILDLVARVLER